jgi:hypothetical protein
MTRYEYLKFLKTVDIDIDMKTGFAYAWSDSQRQVYLESADIQKLVNGVIELCAQAAMKNLIGTDPGRSEVREVFDALKVQ